MIDRLRMLSVLPLYVTAAGGFFIGVSLHFLCRPWLLFR